MSFADVCTLIYLICLINMIIKGSIIKIIILITKITVQTIIAVKAIDNEGLEAFEVVKVKVNGEVSEL